MTEELKSWKFDRVINTLSAELFQTFKKGSKMHKIRYSLLQLDDDIRSKLYRYAFDQYSSQVSLMLRMFDQEYYINFLSTFKDAISKNPNVMIPAAGIDPSKINNSPQVEITVPEILVNISSILMDVYLLSRYFRSWNWNDPKLAIMYVGAQHAESCSDFFTNYLGINPIQFDGNRYENINLPEHYEHPQCLINDNYHNIFIDNLFE